MFLGRKTANNAAGLTPSPAVRKRNRKHASPAPTDSVSSHTHTQAHKHAAATSAGNSLHLCRRSRQDTHTQGLAPASAARAWAGAPRSAASLRKAQTQPRPAKSTGLLRTQTHMQTITPPHVYVLCRLHCGHGQSWCQCERSLW